MTAVPCRRSARCRSRLAARQSRASPTQTWCPRRWDSEDRTRPQPPCRGRTRAPGLRRYPMNVGENSGLVNVSEGLVFIFWCSGGLLGCAGTPLKERKLLTFSVFPNAYPYGASNNSWAVIKRLATSTGNLRTKTTAQCRHGPGGMRGAFESGHPFGGDRVGRV